MSLLHHDAQRDAFDFASHFREDFYACLTRRGDTLFELTDAMLCENGPVTSPVDLTLLAEHRRGHGALYDALNRGRIDVDGLRRALAVLPQPKVADNRLVLAVDVSNWLCPDAPTSPDRLFCHVYGRNGRSSDQVIPGWPYSFVAALETGRTSWCQLLDAVRLGPDDDVAEVTAAQVRRVITDLIDGGQWEDGDADILIVFDAGYDAPRTAYLLGGLPVDVLGRMRSDRVMRKPVPAPWISLPQGGRPPKHGKEFRFAKPDTWGEPDAATVQVTDRYGSAQALGRDRIHPRLTTRSARIDHEGELPLIDFEADSNIDPATIHTLASREWIKKGEPLCLIGDSGTGKSHLLIALGAEAAMSGFRVRYVLAKLVNELVETADERQLTKTIARYGRVDLLCIDELGDMELDRRGAELLFQVLTEREEKNSVAIASNESFSKAHMFRRTRARCCRTAAGSTRHSGSSRSQTSCGHPPRACARRS
ncbi:transposase [Streptomyces sp. NPDC096311]|uniref:transposase n=1 Tax=Streptomyces sp. NPDC096311 TaxID=3366083 RepID=UPI00382BD5ED